MNAPMKVSDVMTTTVTTVGPETPVLEVAALMLERRISGLPVVDAKRRVVGMVSEGDLIRRQEIGTGASRRGWLGFFVSEERQAREFVKSHGLHVSEVMTQPVHSVRSDAPVGDVAQIMQRHHVKRLPVIDDGELVGIVTRADLLRTLAAHRSDPPPPPASDRSIRDRLLKTIAGAPWAASALVNVVVSNGVVQLWGVVDNPDQRKALVVAAEEIPGVKAVEDHMGTDRQHGRSTT